MSQVRVLSFPQILKFTLHRPGIASQFNVAVTPDRHAVPFTLDLDRSLPIGNKGIEFLIWHQRIDIYPDSLIRDTYLPFGRVLCPAVRAAPGLTDIDIKISRTKHAGCTVFFNNSSGIERIEVAIFPLQRKWHQFTAVVQLNREPVPANLIRAQGAGAK